MFSAERRVQCCEQSGGMVHICEYLSTADNRHPSKVLTICQGRQQTARGLLSRVAAFGAGLEQQVGLQSGEVVVLAANSSDYFLESLLALSSIGCIVAPLNLRWDMQEISRAISLCHASTLLVDTANLRLLATLRQPSSVKHKHAVILGQVAHGALDSKHHHAEVLIDQYIDMPLQLQHAPEDAALICFTSGTTGQPKAALISHTALDHQSAAKIQVIGYHAKDRYLHTAPLFHIGGLSSALAVLKAGGTHVFMGKFSARTALDTIKQQHITAIIAVPAMISDLATEAKALPSSSCSGMERVLVGAGGLPQALKKELGIMFPNADCFSAYGMTEACSSMTFKALCSQSDPPSPPSDMKMEAVEHGTCVGLPPAGIEMAVLTANSAEHLSLSHVATVNSSGSGEVLTRGPHVFTRYWDQQTATEQAFLPGLWLRTGDAGFIDKSGQVWLSGRLKDIVRTGGETVHPTQVEAVLLQHPSVTAATVLGLPHERLGEQVAAVIVLNRKAAWDGLLLGSQSECPSHCSIVTGDELLQTCHQALSGYKVPRTIAAQYEPLPLNASGKVMKLQVRQKLLATLSMVSDNSFTSCVMAKL